VFEASERGDLRKLREAMGRVAGFGRGTRAIANRAQPGTGMAPLHAAAARGFLHIVEALVMEYGADASRPNGSSTLLEQPVHFAARNGHLACVAFFVSGGHASVNEATRDWPLLHVAAVVGHTHVVSWLLGAGADVTGRGAAGRSALIRAAFCRGDGGTATARVLLAHGADPDARDAAGEYPALVAASRNPETLRILLDSGANVFFADVNNAYAGTDADMDADIYDEINARGNDSIHFAGLVGIETDAEEARGLLRAAAAAEDRSGRAMEILLRHFGAAAAFHWRTDSSTASRSQSASTVRGSHGSMDAISAPLSESAAEEEAAHLTTAPAVVADPHWSRGVSSVPHSRSAATPASHWTVDANSAPHSQSAAEVDCHRTTAASSAPHSQSAGRSQSASDPKADDQRPLSTLRGLSLPPWLFLSAQDDASRHRREDVDLAEGGTALHVASKFGNLEALEMLLQAEAGAAAGPGAVADRRQYIICKQSAVSGAPGHATDDGGNKDDDRHRRRRATDIPPGSSRSSSSPHGAVAAAAAAATDLNHLLASSYSSRPGSCFRAALDAHGRTAADVAADDPCRIVAAGLRWAPSEHPRYPPAFRIAVRTFLLCLGRLASEASKSTISSSFTSSSIPSGSDAGDGVIPNISNSTSSLPPSSPSLPQSLISCKDLSWHPPSNGRPLIGSEDLSWRSRSNESMPFVLLRDERVPPPPPPPMLPSLPQGVLHTVIDLAATPMLPWRDVSVAADSRRSGGSGRSGDGKSIVGDDGGSINGGGCEGGGGWIGSPLDAVMSGGSLDMDALAASLPRYYGL